MNRLNYLEVLSLASTLLTFTTGLMLNDPKTNESTRIFLSVFILITVIITVAKMIVDMVIFSEDYFNVYLLENKVIKYSELVKLNPRQKVYKLLSYLGSKVRDNIFNMVKAFKYSNRLEKRLGKR